MRKPLPRWAVLSWMISFCAETGDRATAEQYVTELYMWLAFSESRATLG